MLKSVFPKSSASAVHLVVLGAALVLAGCRAEDVALEDYNPHDAFYERYPIKVEQAPVRMGLGTKAGTLKPDQINAVAAFARSARSRIRISYPSGSPHGRAMAGEVGQLLVAQGVAPGMISAASYPGGASAPVQLSYTRSVAVTKECGDWSKDVGMQADNTSYTNFGCALQHNTAAQVADANDFARPHAMDPVTASSRAAALLLYYGGGSGGGGSSSGSGAGAGSGAGGSSGGGSGGGSGG